MEDRLTDDQVQMIAHAPLRGSLTIRVKDRAKAGHDSDFPFITSASSASVRIPLVTSTWQSARNRTSRSGGTSLPASICAVADTSDSPTTPPVSLGSGRAFA